MNSFDRNKQSKQTAAIEEKNDAKSNITATHGLSFMAKVRTSSLSIDNSSENGGSYGKFSSRSNLGPRSISPIVSNKLYSWVLLRRMLLLRLPLIVLQIVVVRP